MSIQFELRKSSSMPLDRLANRAVYAVQLHCTLHLECRWIRRISRNPHQNHPLAVARDAIVDYLRSGQRRVPVKDFCRWRSLVGNCPMVDRSIRDHSNDRVRHPFPEHHVLAVDVGLDFLLCFDVENLQCPCS